MVSNIKLQYLQFYTIINIYLFSEIANWGQCTCLNKLNRFLIHLHPISDSFNGICCPCQMKQCDEKENVFCTVAHLCNIYKIVVSMMVLCLLIILQDFSGIFPLVKLIKCCPQRYNFCHTRHSNIKLIVSYVT